MKNICGIYLKSDENNRIQRMIHTTDGEKIVEDISLNEEVLHYANFKLNSYNNIFKKINETAKEVTVIDENLECRGWERLDKLQAAISEFIFKLKYDDLLLGTLAEITFKGSYRPDNGSLFYLLEVNSITMALLSETISFMNFFRHYVLNYSNNETDEINKLISSFDIPKCEMLMTYENGF